MSGVSLLYKKEYPINDKIKIIIPTVGDIIDSEVSYYGVVNTITAMPIDMMVQLDDLGIDFSTIDEYELFLIMKIAIQEEDTSLIFGDLDLSKFELLINPENGEIILKDEVSDITIDRHIHSQIATVLRKIHGFEKNIRKPGNKEARDYMLEKAKKKAKRNKNKEPTSQLESLIVALVNTEQYKYNYEETRNMSIYQFNSSLQQIIHKIGYDNRMHGVYAGTVDYKSLNPADLNWLSYN